MWNSLDFYDSGVEEKLRQEFLGKNILLTFKDSSGIKNSLNLSVKNFSWQKNYPHEILIRISTRSPILQIVEANPFQKEATLSALINSNSLAGEKITEKSVWLLSDEEVIFAKAATPEALPRLVWTPPSLPELGQSLLSLPTFQFFQKYQKETGAGLPAIDALMVKGNDVLLLLKDSTYLIIDPRRRFTETIRNWTLINSKYFIEGKKLKKVDLRFQNPVVEFQNK